MEKMMKPCLAMELPTRMTIPTLRRGSRERLRNRLSGDLKPEQVDPAIVLLPRIFESTILLLLPLLLSNPKEQRGQAVLVLLHESRVGIRERQSLTNFLPLLI
jgi:hypothetical protein